MSIQITIYLNIPLYTSILVDSEEMRLYFKITAKSYTANGNYNIFEGGIFGRIVRISNTESSATSRVRYIFSDVNIPEFNRALIKSEAITVSLSSMKSVIIVEEQSGRYVTSVIEYALK